MERTVDILIEISIYSAVITAFILLFRAIFKKRISPKVQYAMWLLLVLRLMLPVTIESGFHVESLLPERPAPVVQEESIFEAETPVISEMPAVNMAPVTEVAPVQPIIDTQGENTAPPVISQEIPESTVVSIPEVKEPVIDINWRIAAFWTWAAGALVFGLWMMIVKLRFYEDMQRHTASVSPRVYAIYDECCAALKVKPITMWAVDRAISPGIAFFTYPVLLLPASMDGDEEKLRYAFLHELTHKKRHDHHMTALLTALRIIYWFNPAVHIGFAEMRADMETACDADVIAFVGKEQKRGYLTAILELFSYATRPQLGMSQASSRRMAKQRMKGAFMRERTTFLGRAAALMLAAIMLVGCFTTACQSAPAEVELKAANAVEVPPEEAEQAVPGAYLDAEKSEEWQETFTAGGWLPVTVDTVMDIPLYVNFPVYKMEYYDFTAGKLKHMADKLLGAPAKVTLLESYSEADEPVPSETELSINGRYLYVDAAGQEWSVRSTARGVTIAKYFPDGALIQTEETVMQGEAYPGEPAGTTIGVQRTWQEAYQYVLDALDKLSIVNMTMVNYEKARLIDSSNEIIGKGWYFALSREDGGRTTFYNDRPSAVLMDFEDPEVPLNKEVIRVFVDDTGIENIMWNNPSNVTSIITDTHAPLTFEETKGAIKKAFEAIASYTKGRYPDYAITIEDIDLRSCPVQSEAGASTGYLVPAWVMDLTIGEGDSANNHSWLCVSTIDGSIISHAYMTEAGKRIAQNYDNGLYYEQMGENEKESFRDAILRLYPLADEIAAKGFTAALGEEWFEKSEKLAETIGLRLGGAGMTGTDYIGYTVETPDEYCSNDLCRMYAAVLFAAVPNLYEMNIGNADFITYNTYLDEAHEHLLATAVGDVISREDAEKHWAGLTKPLEEYGTSGSGIRELLSAIAKVRGVNGALPGIIDIDGDGLEDTITVDTDNAADENFDPQTAKATLTVKLGSGETITQEIPGWWQNAEYHTADFDADNRTDIALMLWVGGSNYDATNVYVYHMGNSKLTELAKNVITNDTITYDQSRCSALNGENAPWVSGGTVIKDGEKTVLRLRQLLDYDPGAGISTAYYTNLVWNGNGWFIESMEIGEAYGEEQVYPDTLQYAPVPPDPIDTLSDMDLLIYSSLTNNSKVYALPRTLSGMDLSTSIWDNILLIVNDRYFDGMPYDAAGAAYNVVQVRQNEDGIIDVYLILTYRQYDILNDKLSVTGELNGAAIWHYKENENGEIEFVRVTWPEKDGDGYASSIKKNWPEDLQKYTDFSPDSIGRAERLKAIDEQIALSMDNIANIDSLLGIITSSPKGSSAPIDYIHEHVGEYGQLCAMGRRAVSRFMPRFEKGYETGLEGRIMASVVNALTGIGLVYDHANGQEWYDANRNEILAYMRAADEKAALREAILRLYPLADEITAKGFEAKVDTAFYEKTEALAQTMGLGLIGAGKSGSKKQPGCTIEIPDANCSMELCNMYAAVMFAAVPNLNEVTVGNTDYFNYNYHRTEGWELLLPAVVGDNISREEAEAYWPGLTKPILEEYGTSGSGIRELLRELANLSGIDLASAGLAQDTPLHVSLLQPTPVPAHTPAPATGKHEWRAGKLAIEPYKDKDTSRLELSYYGISLSGNGTEQTESMLKDWFSNDIYSRDGQELLEVHRTLRGTLKLDVDLIQHSAENTKWNPDSETYGAVEYAPTWLPGHNDRVLRMTRRYERGTEDSIPYVTTIYSVLIQYNNSDVVLMFRFLNAKKIKGEWQLYQTDYDCEKWMRTFQINGAPNSIVARAESLVGKPYKTGAYGPDAFDSSGLVYYVVTQAGVYVEKMENCQRYADNANWQKVEDKSELKPGNILFFYGDDTEKIQHAGIYIGDGKMIDASSSHGKVIERSCETDYWKEHFAFARRVA